jgi:colanic acid biosynthesis protein WcaH
MSTPKQDYLNVIKHTQLMALDLIIINEKNEVLLGYRNNNPAKNTWFTFGSRVFKDECFEEACKRISLNELGVKINLKDCLKHGVYSHNYNNNFENEDFGTNYIVFAFIFKLNDINSDSIKGDNQHSIFKWFNIDDIINHNTNNVHENVRNYFIENPPNKIF